MWDQLVLLDQCQPCLDQLVLLVLLAQLGQREDLLDRQVLLETLDRLELQVQTQPCLDLQVLQVQ